MRKAVLLLAPSLLLMMSSASIAELPKPYAQLNRKSIFAKDRVARAASFATTAPATTQPSSSPVLIGIVDDESGYIAIFETPGVGILAPVHLGEALPANAGIVTDITLDYIEFAPSSGPTTAPTTAPATGPTTVPATAPTTGPTTESTAAPTPSPNLAPTPEPATEPATQPATTRVGDLTPDPIRSVPTTAPVTRRVLIGHNLEGTQAAVPVGYDSSASSSSPSTAPIEGDDIVSRMRRRRQQEGRK